MLAQLPHTKIDTKFFELISYFNFISFRTTISGSLVIDYFIRIIGIVDVIIFPPVIILDPLVHCVVISLVEVVPSLEDFLFDFLLLLLRRPPYSRLIISFNRIKLCSNHSPSLVFQETIFDFLNQSILDFVRETEIDLERIKFSDWKSFDCFPHICSLCILTSNIVFNKLSILLRLSQDWHDGKIFLNQFQLKKKLEPFLSSITINQIIKVTVDQSHCVTIFTEISIPPFDLFQI